MLIPFIAVQLQKTGADELAVVFMLCCQMFGHPPCGNFEEHK